MTVEDSLGGFVVDASALALLGGGANIYATTWADRAATRGIVLLVPAAALSEAWQHIRRHGPSHADQMRDLLVSPMIVIDSLDEPAAADAGDLMDGRNLTPDVAAVQTVTCARARDWPVLVADPARVRTIDPNLRVESLPGTS